jgi:hypothetical protein
MEVSASQRNLFFVSAIPDSPASGVGVGGDEEELASANGIDGLREGS